MADQEPEAPADDRSPGGDDAPPPPAEGDAAEGALREAVEARYDFERFGPADMAEMTVEEWQAAFDADAWITGPELLDRVEAELRSRVGDRRLFAVVERHDVGGEPRLLAYTDASYAVVHPDGTVVGRGGLLGEVEPVVALCSMESFDVEAPRPDARLPDPESVEPGSGDLGHRLLLAVAGMQLVAGVVLLFSPLVVSAGPGSGALTTVVGLAFVVVGLVVGVLVANARLSDRFRAAAYRERLRAAGVGGDARPAFLPPMDGTGAAGRDAVDDAGGDVDGGDPGRPEGAPDGREPDAAGDGPGGT